MLGSHYGQKLQQYFFPFLEQYLVIKQSFAGLRLSRWQIARLLLAQVWRDMTVKAAAYAACAVVLLVGIIIWTCRLVHARAPKSIQELGVPLVGQSKGRRMEFRQLIDAAANMVRTPGAIMWKKLLGDMVRHFRRPR